MDSTDKFHQFECLFNESNGRLVARFVRIADSFVSRFVGLLATSSFKEEHALIIKPCNQVHSFFMQYPIDLVFCDTNHVVLATHSNFCPWKVSKGVKNAQYVIELPLGTINKVGIYTGDQLAVKKSK